MSDERNLKRFPPDFMFQLTEEEWLTNSSQIVMTSNRPKSALPYAFTEQGVAIGELSSRIEEKKQAPRRKIGFQQNMED